MESDMNSDGRIVVILGMDRTGTSLCTNILNALGMRLSPRLVPGDQFNENGYFEDWEILQAHEQILAALDRYWDTLEAIHPFPSQWWQSPAMDPFRDALVDVVRRRSAEGPGIWGFKDPRTAVLLPLWNEVFRICEVRPVFVLCVRHPAAAARSVSSRDRLMHGTDTPSRFSLLFPELLWFEKTLSGCLAIQEAPHCLIHYEEWFKDPLPQTRMLCDLAGLAPSGGPAALKERVSSIISSALRHQDGGAIESTAARDLYAHLVQSTKVPDRGVLRHFEFACEVGRDYFSEVRHLLGKRHLEPSALVDRCREAEQNLTERDARVSELEEERSRWMQRCSGAEDALVEHLASLRESEEDRVRCLERCSGVEHALVERDARLREMEEDRVRWEERRNLTEQDAQRWNEQFLRVACLLEERDREIAAMRASATWRWTQSLLRSRPAQLLLGPFIRAVSGQRKA